MECKLILGIIVKDYIVVIVFGLFRYRIDFCIMLVEKDCVNFKVIIIFCLIENFSFMIIMMMIIYVYDINDVL